MTGGQWWLSALPTELNQGDIFADIAFMESLHPRVHLKAGATLKGGDQPWVDAKAQPAIGEHESKWLAMGPPQFGMLLNHGCDLDKGTNKRCVLVPVISISRIPPDQHQNVIAQRSIPLMYLPDVPGCGDMVADFRIVANIPRKTINGSKRIASMTPDAQLRMQAQLIKFYTRTDFPQAVGKPPPHI